MQHREQINPIPVDKLERRIEQVGSASYHHEVVDVRTIFQIVWRAKLWLLLAALLGGAYGAYVAHSFRPEYIASMIVDARGSESNTLSTQFASAVRMVGSLGTSGGQSGDEQSTTFQRLQVLFSSRRLAEALETKYQMLGRVYGDQWNTLQNRGQSPDASVPTESTLRRHWRGFFNLNKPQPPSIESLAQYVGNSIQVLPIPESVFVDVSYQNEDPVFAKWFLSVVFQEADELTRLDDLNQTERRKDYILRKLQEVTITDMRTGLLGMLSSLERREMFLRSDDTYSAQIVEDARTSLQPTEPNLLVMIGGWAFGALFVVAVFVVLLKLARSESSP